MASLSMMPMIYYPASSVGHVQSHKSLRRKISCAIISKYGQANAKANASSIDEHWNYCREMLPKVSRTFAPLILQLPQPQLRDAYALVYLVLRNIDTIEDDMELAAEDKIPVLRDFHHHMYDRDWRYICGRGSDKELTKGNHHLNAAFLDLDTSCQETILKAARITGEGMAKFISKEIEAMSELDEYIGYVCSSGMCTLFKLAHILIGEDLIEDSGVHHMAVLLQKHHSIQSYYEDMTEIPPKKISWPANTWGKYVDKLEDLQDEVNSVQAAQFLNEMITNTLSHVEATLDVIAKVKDLSVLQFMAVPRIVAIGELALYYNNPQVFREKFRMKPHVRARILDGKKTIADTYRAFYDASRLMESKVKYYSDPHASETLSRLEAIKQKCMDSGTLSQRSCVIFESNDDIM